jgi:hypothetical protein
MRQILLGSVLGFLAVLDDVTGLKEDPLQHLPPDRFLAEQKLQVHSEVFELLLLSVLHNRLRFGVFLNLNSLLIPTDGFGFFDDRSNHPGERAYFFRELGRWLVVLIESHRSMVAYAHAVPYDIHLRYRVACIRADQIDVMREQYNGTYANAGEQNTLNHEPNAFLGATNQRASRG